MYFVFLLPHHSADPNRPLEPQEEDEVRTLVESALQIEGVLAVHIANNNFKTVENLRELLTMERLDMYRIKSGLNAGVRALLANPQGIVVIRKESEFVAPEASS